MAKMILFNKTSPSGFSAKEMMQTFLDDSVGTAGKGATANSPYNPAHQKWFF
jgi:hypothetical protein